MKTVEINYEEHGSIHTYPVFHGTKQACEKERKRLTGERADKRTGRRNKSVKKRISTKVGKLQEELEKGKI